MSNFFKYLLASFALLLVAVPAFSQFLLRKTDVTLALPYEQTLAAEWDTGMAWRSVNPFAHQHNIPVNIGISTAIDPNIFQINSDAQFNNHTLVISTGATLDYSDRAEHVLTIFYYARNTTRQDRYLTVTLTVGNPDLRASLHKNLEIPKAIKGQPYFYVIPNKPYPRANDAQISYRSKLSQGHSLLYYQDSRLFRARSIPTSIPDTKPITMTVWDGSFLSTLAIQLTVANNNPPALDIGDNQTRSYRESTKITAGTFTGVTLGVRSVNTPIVTLINDPDFALLNGGSLFFAKDKVFDYEATGTTSATQGKYKITVTGIDGNDLMAVKEVTLTITNVDDPPVVTQREDTSNLYRENEFPYRGEIGGWIRVEDPEGANVSGELLHRNDFRLNAPAFRRGVAGWMAPIVLESERNRSRVGFDYETEGTVTISIKLTDETNNSSYTEILFTVSDRDEPPTVHLSLFNVNMLEKGKAYTLVIPEDAYVDPEGMSITYTDSASPSWLTYNQSTRTYTGSVPTNASIARLTMHLDVGAHTNVDASYSFKVTNSSPPVINILGSVTVMVVENLSLANPVTLGVSITVIDVAGDTIGSTTTSGDNFSINDKGEIVMGTAQIFNYEENNDYTLTIIATDSDSDTTTVRINFAIQDVNEPPVITQPGAANNNFLEVRLFNPFSTRARLAITDPESDPFTYTHTRTDKFEIRNNLEIWFKAGVIDYEVDPGFTITVTATDSKGNSSMRNVIIPVRNRDDNPTVHLGIKAPVAVAGGAYNFTIPLSAYLDPEGSAITWSERTNGTPSWLSFTGGTRVFTGTAPSTPGTAPIRLYAAAGRTLNVDFNVTIQANPGPYIEVSGTQSVAILENAVLANDLTFGYSIGITDNTDVDSVTFSDTAFSIDSTSRKLVMDSSKRFNYEVNQTYTLTITATDDATPAVSSTYEITLIISNVNEAPQIFRSGSQDPVDEGTYTVHTNTGYRFAGTDVDANTTLNYTVSDTVNFTVNMSGLYRDLQVRSGASLDYEETTARTHTITITVSDGSLTATNVVTITVSDANDAPVVANPVRDQRAQTNAVYSFQVPANTFSDPDAGDSLSYSASHPSWLSFAGSTRTFSAVAADVPAARNTVTVTVTATDTSNLSAEDDFEIVINNSPPPVIRVVGGVLTTFVENTAITAGAPLGISLTITDDGTVNATTFSDTDFNIDGGTLVMSVAKSNGFDYEVNQHYTLTITATDDSTETTTHEIIFNITDVNEQVTLNVTNTQISVNEGTYTQIQDTGFDMVVTDPDEGNTYTYTSSDDRFAVATDGQLNVAVGASFDFETTADKMITITITVNDGATTDTQVVTISISDVDEPPTIRPNRTVYTINEQTVGSNTSAGIIFAIGDPENHSVAGFSISDNTNFRTQGPALRFQASLVLDFETKSSYTVTVTATGSGGTTEATVTISVTDVPEPPNCSQCNCNAKSQNWYSL